MRRKTFAQKYSTSFEKLLCHIVENKLNEEYDIIASINTAEKNDGGYDGYCIIKSTADEEMLALLEAKLRTEFKDLPLSDFSKSVIIAINTNAVCIVIGTNMYFTKNSVLQLKQFQERTGLQIRTIDNIDLKHWLNNNTDYIGKAFDKRFIYDLKKHLNDDFQKAEHSLSLMNDIDLHIQEEHNIKLFGSKRKLIQEQVVNMVLDAPKTIVITGEEGIGKSTLLYSIISSIKHNQKLDNKKPYSVSRINIGSIGNHMDFAYTVISVLWGCKYSETVDFINSICEKQTYDKINEMIPSDILDKLLRIMKNNGNESYDIFYSYIISIYKQSGIKRMNRILWFYNLESASIESLNELIVFIRKTSGIISVFISIDDDNDHLTKHSVYKDFTKSVLESKNTINYQISEWEKDEIAYGFITYLTNDETIIAHAKEIVSYFGKNPAILSAAIDLIKKDKMILTQINNRAFSIDRIYDISKIRSVFICNIKKLTETQLSIVFLLVLIKHPISSAFMSEVLEISEANLDSICNGIPLIVKNDHIFWKIGFFENLITDEEICLSYNIKVKILSNVLNSFENISIDERGKRILKLQIYSKMSDAGSLKKESLPVIKQLKDEEQYSDLYFIYSILLNSKLFDENSEFSISNRIGLIESALKIGLNGNDTDFALEYETLRTIIKNYCIRNDYKSFSSVMLGWYYYVSSIYNLTMSNYMELKRDCQFGLKYTENISTDEALELKSGLCANMAIALKHLENIESCVKYLESNNSIVQDKRIALHPRYQICYHTNHASMILCDEPSNALKEFQDIETLCYDYSKEAYLHNLHNISSVLLIIGDYDGAFKAASKVSELSYEYDNSIEFGRSQNVFGCLKWLQGDIIKAKDYFTQCYNHFQKHQHNTHAWVPLVNLSILCTECNDGDSIKNVMTAYKILTDHHIQQIMGAKIHDNSIPKIIVALLMLLRCFEELKMCYNKKEELMVAVPQIKIDELYNKYINGRKMEDLFKNTSYNCNGIVMLKV